LELRERKFDNYVIILLPFTTEKILADRSPNDQICARAIPIFTPKGFHVAGLSEALLVELSDEESEQALCDLSRYLSC
jgi:hypothetical protein